MVRIYFLRNVYQDLVFSSLLRGSEFVERTTDRREPL